MKTQEMRVEMTVTINLSKSGHGIDLSDGDLRDRIAEFIERLAEETQEDYDDDGVASIDTDETDGSIAVY